MTFSDCWDALLLRGDPGLRAWLRMWGTCGLTVLAHDFLLVFLFFFFFSIFLLWPHEPGFNRQSSPTFPSPIGLNRDPSPAAELIGTPFHTEFHTESYMSNQNYFSPAVHVALHQALNFICCLIAQLGVILPPFCQLLLDFLGSDLTCKRCHLTGQVFPKSFAVLVTARTLAEGGGNGGEEGTCRSSPAAVKSHCSGLQERRCCAFCCVSAHLENRYLRSDKEPPSVQDFSTNCPQFSRESDAHLFPISEETSEVIPKCTKRLQQMICCAYPTCCAVFY